MDIQFRPLRGLDYVASVLSWGLWPFMIWRYKRQLPIRLTEEAMIFRDGREVPWSDFKRLKVTHQYYGQTYVGTRVELWHSTGKVEIDTDKVRHADAVVQFLSSHLPRVVIESAQEKGSTRGRSVLRLALEVRDKPR